MKLTKRQLEIFTELIATSEEYRHWREAFTGDYGAYMPPRTLEIGAFVRRARRCVLALENAGLVDCYDNEMTLRLNPNPPVGLPEPLRRRYVALVVYFQD